MKTRKFASFRCALPNVIIVAALGLSSAHAVTYDWSGATDGNMSGTPANWGGTEPGSLDIARWNAASYTTAPSANANMTIGQLLFDAGNTVGITFGTGALTLTLNGISGTGLQINSGSGAVNTGSAKFALGASQNWRNNSASTLTVGGTINLGASNTLTLNGTGNVALSGVISGASNIAINGGGTATINNTGNTFGGVGSTVTVSGGSTLGASRSDSNPNAFGSSANSIVVNGGTLKFTQSNDPSSSLANAIEFQTGGANILNNAASSANRGVAISGALTGSGGFTATNSATASIMALLNISGSSTLSGTVTATGGTLFVASNSLRDALASASLNLNGGKIIFTGSAANVGAIADFTRAIAVTANSSLGAGAGFTFTQTGNLTGTGTLSINTAPDGGFTNAGLANQVLSPGATSVVVLNGDVTGFSGNLSVNQGTLRIGSSATLPSTFGLLTMANTAGVNLDLNGRSVTVRGLASGGTTGGNIQGNSTGSANTLTINTTGTDRSYAGIISNGGSVALNLTKIGTNTQTLTGANTYTGTTTINGGTLATTTGANITARIQGGGSLVLGGGILSVTGSTTAATNVTQSFSGTTLNAGLSGVTSTTGVGTSQSNIALGAITRNTGSQVNFTLPSLGSITTTTANAGTTGILGGYATVANDNWANSAGDGTIPGAITAYSGYQTVTGGNSALLGTTGFETNVNYAVAATGPVAANSTVNSIRVGVASTITLAGTLTVTSGGILIPSSAGGTVTFTGGTLQGTAATGLNLFNRMGGQDLKITSVIADNGGATALTITGASFVVLTGTTVNTYSGETYVSGTSTRLRLGGAVNGSNANLGDQTVGAALNINGGALYYDGNFALDNAGANKRNVVIGSMGATFRPVPTATTDALTISGVISGSDFGALQLGGASTLTLTNGGGNLILTGTNTYNGGTIISGNGVNASPSATAPTLILGNNNALGTGALTFAGAGSTTNVLGLRSLDATNLTLANRIGDISGTGVTLKFGSSSTGNLTFTDTTSASLGAGATRTFQVDNSQTSFANGFSNTSNVTKTGTGTLVFGGVNTYTGTTTIKAGTLTLGASGSIASTSLIVGDTAFPAVLDVSALPGSLLTMTSGKTLSGLGNITGNVTFSTGGKYTVAIAATAAAQDPLLISGNLTFSSGSLIDLTAAAAPAAGTYVLATASGGVTNSGFTVNYGTITGGNVSISGNDLILTVGSVDPYTTWSGGAGFYADANNDGVPNGLAWILGAANTTVSALGLLPTPTVIGGNLTLSTFNRVNPKGTAKLFVEYSNDLSTWISSETASANGTYTPGNFTITIAGTSPQTVSVTVSSAASAAGKLFARLRASEN